MVDFNYQERILQFEKSTNLGNNIFQNRKWSYHDKKFYRWMLLTLVIGNATRRESDLHV